MSIFVHAVVTIDRSTCQVVGPPRIEESRDQCRLFPYDNLSLGLNQCVCSIMVASGVTPQEACERLRAVARVRGPGALDALETYMRERYGYCFQRG